MSVTRMVYNVKIFVLLQGMLMAACKDDMYQSRNMNPVDPSQWNLPPAHAYDRIFEITSENHEVKVVNSNDAWIVVYYKRKVHPKWEELAEVIEGSVWIGTVDVEANGDLVKEMNIDMESFNERVGLALVYPMKSNKKREAFDAGKLKSTTKTKEAVLFASATIPDRSTDFIFSVEEQQKFNDWIVKGYYYEQPPKFPVICLIDDTETPIHVKVLSEYMYTHFNFGIVRKVNVPAMRKLFEQVPQPQKYPTFLVLLGIEPSSEAMAAGSFQMRFNIVPFIEKKYGDARHIRSLMNFLFVVNDDYRESIPGKMPLEPSHISNMDSIRSKLTQRVADAAIEEDDYKRASKTEL